MKTSLYLVIYHNHKLVHIVALSAALFSYYRKVMRLKQYIKTVHALLLIVHVENY